MEKTETNSRSEEPTSIVFTCAYCKKPTYETRLRKCGKCTVEWYCSREHQVAHWPVHKLQCQKMSKNRENYDKPEYINYGNTVVTKGLSQLDPLLKNCFAAFADYNCKAGQCLCLIVKRDKESNQMPCADTFNEHLKAAIQEKALQVFGKLVSDNKQVSSEIQQTSVSPPMSAQQIELVSSILSHLSASKHTVAKENMLVKITQIPYDKIKHKLNCNMETAIPFLIVWQDALGHSEYFVPLAMAEYNTFNLPSGAMGCVDSQHTVSEKNL